MKLGDVLKKEREARGLSEEEMAARLEIPPAALAELEGGASAAERWGPILANIAIELQTPTSRLLAESGRSADSRKGQAGPLIARHRDRHGRTPVELAAALGLSLEEYEQIERGESPIEDLGRLFLRFAETIEQPVFNLFYPCGLPFQELDDYP
jgi:transcriptional regulator with XRE-family HTH domain